MKKLQPVISHIVWADIFKIDDAFFLFYRISVVRDGRKGIMEIILNENITAGHK